MAHAAARVIIAPRLRLSSYLALRLAVPFIAFLPLSMSYTLISVAFGLPFNGRCVPPHSLLNQLSAWDHVLRPTPLSRFSYAGGFFLAFVFNYLGMLALGLSLEAMITLLTPKFIPYFLFLLVGRSSVSCGGRLLTRPGRSSTMLLRPSCRQNCSVRFSRTDKDSQYGASRQMA